MQLTVSKGLSTILAAGRILTTHLQKVVLRNVTKVLGFGRFFGREAMQSGYQKSTGSWLTYSLCTTYICNDHELQGNCLRFLTAFLITVFTCVEGKHMCRSRNYHHKSKCKLLSLVTNIHHLTKTFWKKNG